MLSVREVVKELEEEVAQEQLSEETANQPNLREAVVSEGRQQWLKSKIKSRAAQME